MVDAKATIERARAFIANYDVASPIRKNLDKTCRLMLHLADGLRQVAEGDYPADAVTPETWAREVLTNPDAVLWDVDEAALSGRSTS